jgi:hypothetical protein
MLDANCNLARRVIQATGLSEGQQVNCNAKDLHNCYGELTIVGKMQPNCMAKD